MAQTHTSSRGFVIIVVLAAIAVISAVVAGQLISSQKAQVAGLRTNEEVRARGIAQACLEMLSSYAENLQPDAGPGSDLDLLLAGPNGANGSPSPDSDDFLPFGTTRTAAIPAGSTSPLHQWNLVDIPGSGGLCAVRFDDNSDDGRPDLPTPGGAGDPDSPGEGVGNDVPNMDRDQSVYLTVIGMYPVLPGTADADAYAKAHTRVTLKRLIQKENIFQPLAPALWAGNFIDLKNNNDICGAGGVMSPAVNMGNNSCSCGDLITNTATGPGIPTPGETCACPTFCPPANDPDAGVLVPPVNVHWTDFALTANESLGAPQRADPVADPAIGQGSGPAPGTNYDLSDASICAFYADLSDPAGDERIYVWDAHDTDALTTHLAASGLTAAAFTFPVAVVGPIDCTNHTGSVPPPCVWNLGLNTMVCPSLQSACWKLVARLDDFNTPDLDVQLGGGTTAGWTGVVGGEYGFHPRQHVAIPNVAGGRGFGRPPFPVGMLGLCGDPVADNCDACSTSSATDNSFGFVELHSGSGEHFHWENGAHDDLGPSPSIWFVRESTSAPSSRDVHLDAAGSAGDGPLRATFVTDGSIEVESSVSLCCANCDCSAIGNSTSIPSTSCDATTTFGAVPDVRITGFVTANPGLFNYSNAAPLIENRGSPGGFALKATKDIHLQSTLILGDVRGDTVFVDNGCIVGTIGGYSGLGDGRQACGGSSPCDEPSVCVATDAHIIGDIHSMADIDFPGNNLRFYGNIAAEGSACFKNNAELEGTVMVSDTIDMKNNATIVNTTSSALGTPQAANRKVVTFMEATW